MDPITIALLAASAVAGISGAVAKSSAGGKAKKHNRQELDELLGREQAGQLGLSGTEKTLLDQQLNAPVQAAAAEARNRAERISASTGMGSGQQQAQLRTEQSRGVMAGAQNAALQIAGQDAARVQQERNEIEQRLGLQAANRRDEIDASIEPIAQTALVGGQLAGAPPGTTQAAGLFGTPRAPVAPAPAAPMLGIPNPSAAKTTAPASPTPVGFSQEELKQLEDMAMSNPAEFAQLYLARMRAVSAGSAVSSAVR